MGGIATIDGLSRNFGMSGVTPRQDGIHTYRSIGVSATYRAASFGKERREISTIVGAKAGLASRTHSI
jgi:hypothetical protein